MMSDHVRRLREALGNELLVLPSVTGIVFDAEGRMLLVLQTSGNVWSTPGGAVDPLESPADAVVREVWEETGLHTKPRRILAVFGGEHCVVDYPNGDRTAYVNTVFECEVLGGTLAPDGEETSEVRYFARGEVAKIDMARWLRRVIDGLFDRSCAGHFEPATWCPPASAP